MKTKLTTLLLLLSIGVFSQTLDVMSWNIQNFGKSKDSKELSYMADVMIDYDIIAIQEVSTSSYGEDRLQELVDTLDSRGADKWFFTISEATDGSGSEKYAYVFNSNRTQLIGTPKLSSVIKDSVAREPFIASFYYRRDTVMLVNFHAVPTSKRPQDEVDELYMIDSVYKDHNIIFMGDLNLHQYHLGFSSLKARGYAPSLIGKPTSLRTSPDDDGDIFSKEYDNFFYELTSIRVRDTYVVNFTEKFQTLSDARKISDHCPIVLKFYIND